MGRDVVPFSSTAKNIGVGSIYEHYKGPRYKVLGVAHHSETLEEVVIYHPENKASDVWVRPLNMFLENITIDGVSRPRFRRVDI